MKKEEPRKTLISERIVGRQMTPRRAFRYLGLAALCGLLFGGLAAVAFTGVRRIQSADAQARQEADETAAELTLPAETAAEASSSFEGETGLTEEASMETEEAGSGAEAPGEEGSVTDGSQTEDESSPEDEAVSGAELTEADTSEEDPESTAAGSGRESDGAETDAEDGMDGAERSGEDAGKESVPAFVEAQKAAVAQTAPYVVTVNAITTSATWFESPVESTRNYAGIILDVTEQEILILTTTGPTDSETLRVVFSDGTTRDAYVRQVSPRDGLAMLAVPAEEEDGETPGAGMPGIGLADSFAADVGDPLIAIGAPLGVVNSCAFGTVGYVNDAEPALDGTRRILYADIRTNAAKGSFIINTGGELLGIAAEQDEQNSFDAGLSRIITIGSVKDTIDCMEAAEKQAYIGLEGFSVSDEMILSGIPEGMCVTNVYTDSPAYTAGIKRGDIVIGLNDAPVSDTYDYAEIMRGLRPEETVSMKVGRGSADGEYHEIDFILVTGER